MCKNFRKLFQSCFYENYFIPQHDQVMALTATCTAQTDIIKE